MKAAKSMEFRQRLRELERFADLRNSIVHWFGVAGPEEAIAEPHAEIVARYENLVRTALKPAKAESIAVPKSKIFTATLDDSTLAVIREMHARVYTHVPVLEKRILAGVFSENTILSYLAANEIVGVDTTTQMNEFRDFLPIRAHKSESFAFAPRDATVAQVSKLFRESLEKKIRLGAVFLTENGKETEDLLGLITAWDLAGADDGSGPGWF